MKAPVFVGSGKPLSIETLPDPTPGPGQLVVQVGRCGVCGTDLDMTSGETATFPDGMVLGHEYAGEVVEVGPDTDGFRVGDVVAALPVIGCGECGSCRSGDPAWCDHGLNGVAGGFGQYAVATASAAIKLPASMSVVDGALVEPLAVSLHGVRIAEIPLGAKVLVIGAGPVGVAAGYWAKRLGASAVVTASRSRRGESFALELGADQFLLNDDELTAAVTEKFGGPPDVVFECSGAPGALARAIELVRSRGTVVVLGNCMVPDTIYPTLAMFKQVRIQGSMVYSISEFEFVAASFDAGHVEPRVMVTDTWTYDQLPGEFDALRKPNNHCKALINPWA